MGVALTLVSPAPRGGSDLDGSHNAVSHSVPMGSYRGLVENLWCSSLSVTASSMSLVVDEDLWDDKGLVNLKGPHTESWWRVRHTHSRCVIATSHAHGLIPSHQRLASWVRSRCRFQLGWRALICSSAENLIANQSRDVPLIREYQNWGTGWSSIDSQRISHVVLASNAIVHPVGDHQSNANTKRNRGSGGQRQHGDCIWLAPMYSAVMLCNHAARIGSFNRIRVLFFWGFRMEDGELI